MKPYVVNNKHYYARVGLSYDNDDLCWVVIWANAAEEILALYKEGYDNAMLDYGEKLTLDDLDWSDVSDKVSTLPEKETPYLERRLLVEREAGFCMPGKSYCENCEMAACDFDQYRVCSSCYLCKECRRWVNENDHSEEVCQECLPYLDDLEGE